MVHTIPMNQHHALLIAVETTFGTAVTPSKDVGLVETFNFDENNNPVVIEGSGSREVQDVVEGQYTGNLRCTMKYQHGRIFEYVFGGTTVHAQTSSDWKHTFAVGSLVDSITVGHSYNLTTDQVRTFNGVKVNNLTVEYALGQPIKVTWDGEFKSVDDTTSALSAVLSSIPVLKSHNASLAIGTDGSEDSVGNLESFRITFKNQLVRSDGAGSRESTNILADTLMIDFEFTKSFDSITHYEQFLGGTSPGSSVAKKSLVFNAHNGVSLGSGRREINIDLSSVMLSTHGESKQLRGKVMQTFRGQATTINDVYTVDNISSSNWE